MPVYQLIGLLNDADLFRRLRTRGQARGPNGIDDLRRALDLVTGVPFDQMRAGGYGWLAENPVDDFLRAAIVDVAHIVATHALAEGRPDVAIWAAEKAITTAPAEDKSRLDLARATAALGSPEEAERYLAREVHNRSDDGGAPPGASHRTTRVLKGDRG